MARDPQYFHPDINDRTLAPVKGKVRCLVCRTDFPFDQAAWFQMLHRGIILIDVPVHLDCASGKDFLQLQALVNQAAWDFFVPRVQRHTLPEHPVPLR